MLVPKRTLNYFQFYSTKYIVIFLCTIFFIYTELGLAPRLQNIKFKLDNPHISKSYIEDEVIGGWECIILSVLISSIVVFWYCTIGTPSLRKTISRYNNNIHEAIEASYDDDDDDDNDMETYSSVRWVQNKYVHFLHLSLICLLMVITINGAMTNSLKLIIGNFRPDFLARCQPKPLDDEQASVDGYYGLDICQQPNKYILIEGLKSTPSGHSSFITAGLGFLFVWQSKFIVGHYLKHVWCLVLIVIVMIERITDHRHHWYDVLSGSLLGWLIIWACWRNVFTKQLKRRSLLPAPVTASMD
ncbi:phosphatidate phosphatase LPP1 NDAI_0F04350 [Naumovozyma dairenensis CBS 421]|uniref:Phosphatidic acid phosphatase type 2/haloperoxidase domain-containing protein n=1 Tax=Naumovozyma dairenensis (strain ATCC 10597 / BCRC 20456 / CBS 421 / NBRC 0211 / NRRL Y-12639) TaxID=1071378 RepID=G0WD92_NAUDC|nr:hypothetical protein NDAI_0F04350 [Naumovozyma dairenensis CBS 421]CCD25753.1 hypothetical protein NDAI_0F04350 [Naumovozyma dairenensis CBS 421]